MSVNAYSNFSKGWYLGEKLCILSAAFRYILTYADWMIVALIAFSKCIHLLKPRLGKLVFSGPSGHLIAVSLWFIAILVCLLEFFWVILTFESTYILSSIRASICLGTELQGKIIQWMRKQEYFSTRGNRLTDLGNFFVILTLIFFSAWHIWLQLSPREL